MILASFFLTLSAVGSALPPVFLGKPDHFTWLTSDVNFAFNFLVVARLIGGIGVGVTHAVSPLYIGEVKTPLVADIADISRVIPPAEALNVNIEAVNCFCRSTDKFVPAGCLARPFERLQFLRGTENLMMDLALNLQDMLKLLHVVHDFYMREIDLWCKTQVDGICFMDDWGAQRSLLIDPSMWRKIFKPLYSDYIRLIHSYGKKAFMHSDGCISDILGDMAEL